MKLFRTVVIAIAALVGAVSFCAEAAPAPKQPTAILSNGLAVYTKPGQMGDIAKALEARGYRVEIWNHNSIKRLTQMPDVLIGHSMGGNAVLKRAHWFKKNPPKLLIAIDAGRRPLWSRAPAWVRTLSYYCPLHPIGGQYVEGAENVEVCGSDHLVMPRDYRIVEAIVAEVEKLKQ